MAEEKWDEAGRFWEADHGLLEADQIAQCARADTGAMFPSPVPTRMVSNGEYMPVPQTKQQRQVEAGARHQSATAVGFFFCGADLSVAIR